MASKRHHRRKACEGKVRHDSKIQALYARRLMIERTGERLGAYRCPFCRQWHLGHTPRRIQLLIEQRYN